MIPPPNGLAWNMLGDTESIRLYTAHRAVAAHVERLKSNCPAVIILAAAVRRRRGRPRRFSPEQLRVMYASYMKHCRATGDWFTIVGLAEHTNVPERSWHRYLEYLECSPESEGAESE